MVHTDIRTGIQCNSRRKPSALTTDAGQVNTVHAQVRGSVGGRTESTSLRAEPLTSYLYVPSFITFATRPYPQSPDSFPPSFLSSYLGTHPRRPPPHTHTHSFSLTCTHATTFLSWYIVASVLQVRLCLPPLALLHASKGAPCVGNACVPLWLLHAFTIGYRALSTEHALSIDSVEGMLSFTNLLASTSYTASRRRRGGSRYSRKLQSCDRVGRTFKFYRRGMGEPMHRDRDH